MNESVFLAPGAFVQEMERHWTIRLGNVASAALRSAWAQLATAFGRHILAHDNPAASTEWTVLQPPTGSGKSQGTAVYCSMLAKYESSMHPGALIVTRLKSDADNMADTINGLAGRSDGYAFSYHSDKAGKGILDSLRNYPILVITHRAYELALDHLGQEGSIRQTWPFFHTWGETGRKLIVIDEALDIVEESRGELEGLRQTLAAIPQKLREQHSYEVQAVAAIVSILEQIAGTGAAEGREAVLLKEMISQGMPPDISALRASLREVRFDLQQRRSDITANKAMAELHDDRLRSLQNIFTSWVYYAKVPIHGHTLNSARLLVPDSVKGATVLDATASANVIYTLFDKAHVVKPPEAVRSYKNVTLRVSRGHKVGKVHLRNNGDPLIDRLILTLNEQLRGKKAFVVTHKDIEPKLLARNTSFGMMTGHWGAVDGSNQWRDCDSAVIFGLPYRPDTWTANAFFALQGVRDTAWLRSKERPFKGHSDIRAALKTGQIVTEVIQAINRIRCRKVIDLHGNCPKADVYVLLPAGPQVDAILKGIGDLMEGICVQPWELLGTAEEVKKAGRPSKSGTFQAILTYLDNMWPGSVSASMLKKELGISAASLNRFIAQTKDASTAVAKSLESYGVIFRVQGQGRAARSTFVKQ